MIFGVLSYSCITNRDTNMLQNYAVKQQWNPVSYDYYKLHPNDYITYSVYSTDQEAARLFSASADQSALASPEQTVSYRIFPDGSVDLPFIGKFYPGNKTVSEAEVLLRAKVREYIPDAEVRLVLSSEFFYVIGGGRVPVYKNRMTLYQALAAYSGKNPNLDKKHVRLIRPQNDGSFLVKTLDLRQASIIESEFYYIRPNDIIYFPETNKSFFQLTSVPDFLGFVMMPVSVLLLILNL